MQFNSLKLYLTAILLIGSLIEVTNSFKLIQTNDENNINLKQQVQTPSALNYTENCRQYYPRLFYTNSQDRMIVKFNTLTPCNRSYVTVTQNYSITKYYCTSSVLRIEQTKIFQRYIQECLIVIKTSFDDFNYTVYGQSGNMSRQKLYFQQLQPRKNSENFRVNIPNSDKTFNLIVLADWGPMKVKTYQSVYPSLARIINQNSPIAHGLMIIGDVAYNLDSNQCQQYELFMEELAVVSPYLPIIPITGNHETFSHNNLQIFRKTFECYNLTSDQRVQAYNFWNLKVVTFDPYYQIYNRSNSTMYEKMRSGLIKQLNQSENTNKIVIITSHYPVICSQDVFHCQQTLKSLAELYGQISKLHQVDLYLGAHMHQYERVVPYIDGKFDLQKKTKKQFSKGEMPSIVEGVAGCDVGIIDEEYTVQDFSVTHTYNKTGYGILSVDKISSIPSATYTHYLTISQNETTIFDKITINIDKKTQQ